MAIGFGMNIKGGNVSTGNMVTQAVRTTLPKPTQQTVTNTTQSVNTNLSALTKNFAPVILPPVASTPGSTLAGTSVSPAIAAAIHNPTVVSAQFTNGSTTPALHTSLNIGSFVTKLPIANLVTRTTPSALLPTRRTVPQSPTFRLPSVQLTIPTPLGPDTLHVSEYTDNNGLYQPVPTNGICAYRPEIIAMMDYNNLYGVGLEEYSASGKFLVLNYEARVLRENTLANMFDALQNEPTAQSLFATYKAARDATLQSIQDTLSFFNANIQQINNVKKAFEVKHLSRDHYDTSQFLTLEEFFERRMKYGRNAFAAFSDTKVLYQTLFDMRSMMERYSLSLLNSNDSDRGNTDLDPIRIDRTYSDGNNFSFSIQGNRGKFPFTQNDFNSLGNSLPNDPDDRIKLLISTLAKELRVSRGLSQATIRDKLVGYFGGSPDGNPFDNLVGTVGADIFETPQGTNSLASLFQINGSNSISVLPFEKKTVDDNQTSFVPGSRYFVDSILQLDVSAGTPRFNTGPLNDYVQHYSEVVANVKLVLNELFQFSTTTNSLQTEVVFTNFLLSVRAALGTLGSDAKSTEQLVFLSLFRLAAKDNQLKIMLFQYLLLLGLASNELGSEKELFLRLAGELKVLTRLNYVKVDENEIPDLLGGMSTLSPYLRQLSLDIETRVVELLNPSLIQRIGVRADLLGNTTVVRTAEQPTTGSTRRAADFSSTIQPVGLLARTTPSSTEDVLVLETRAVSSALISAANGTVSNLMKEFVDFVYKLDKNASISGNDRSYVLGTDTSNVANATLTRFNQLSTSTLLAMSYELYVAFLSKYFTADFKRTSDITHPGITQDTTKNAFVLEVIAQLAPLSAVVHGPVRTIGHLGTATPVGPTTATQTTGLRHTVQTRFGGLAGGLFSNNPADSTASEDVSSATQNAAAMGSGEPPTAEVVRVGSDRVGGAGEAVPAGTTDDPASQDQLGRLGTGTISALARTNSETAIHRVTHNPALFSIYTSLRDALFDVRTKLADEDKIVRNVVHILDVIGDNLMKITRQSLAFFANASNNDILKIKDFGTRLSPSQTRTSNWIYNTYKTELDMRGGFSMRVVSSDDMNALRSMLREPIFTKTLANKRTKLLSVGIPYGFTDKLIDRLPRSSIGVKTDLEQQTEADLVAVTVWKRTAEDDDIVFYPQKFLFDLSLFPKRFDGIGIDPSLKFDNLLNQVSVSDFSTELDTTDIGKTLTVSQLSSDARWNVLSSEQQRELFRNHVVSYLLEQYLYLSTGLRITEDTFPMDAYSTDPFVVNNSAEGDAIINAYLSLVKHYTPQQIAALQNLDFTDPTIPEEVKDDVRLLKSSSALQLSTVSEKVLNPKKFDRVLHVPVDIDTFIVDEQTTKSTISGKKALAKNSFRKKLSPTSTNGDLFYVDRSREPNALVFDEFFVTVETVR